MEDRGIVETADDSAAADTAVAPTEEVRDALADPETTTDSAADAAPAPRRHLARDLTLIVLGVVVALAAVGVGGWFTYRALYSPSAFVRHYLSELSQGHAHDALKIPGVTVDRSRLEASGMPKNSSEALLRRAALAQLDDVRVVSEVHKGDVISVTASYSAGGYDGKTTFQVATDGWDGVVPRWRFARSPLAVIKLTVHGSMSFEVNGFDIDKRQVALAGSKVDPADAVPLLVFSPGLYSVRVDTAISQTPGVAVLSDSPSKAVPVTVQSEPTKKFIGVVQDRVDDFLTQCATQQVLQPTGCPFGYVVQNRLAGLPEWSLTHKPEITVVPHGEGWAIPATSGTAHIDADIRSLFDGSISHVDEDVPFSMTGTIDVQPDGAASIRISDAGLD